MRTESVMYFTEKEEEFANLLIEIGTKRNVAKVLVFLANTPEATSRAIERGTDLRQPEVSIAMRYLIEQSSDHQPREQSREQGTPGQDLRAGKTHSRDHGQYRKRKEEGSDYPACPRPEVTRLYPVK